MTLADLEAYQAGDPRADRRQLPRLHRSRRWRRRRRVALTMIQMPEDARALSAGRRVQGLRLRQRRRRINVMADAMRMAFADRVDLDGRCRLRAGAGQGTDRTRSYCRPARQGDHAGRAHRPEPGARRSARPSRRQAPRRHSPDPSPSRRPGPAKRPRTSRWWTSGATWCRTPTPSNRRTASACSPVTRSERRHVPQPRLPAEQRVDRLQYRADA